MYKKYLEYFYQNNGNISEFSEYFNVKFWKETVEEIQFLSGKIKKNNTLSSSSIEYLKQQIIIDLVSSNKEKFNSDEKVRISADLKNVPSLNIKIFSLCKTDSIKKSHLILEKVMNFDHIAVHIKFRYKFEFPELDNKKGLFMIKFSTDCVYSQAVVQKGSLSVVDEHQNTGQVAYILDEKNKICRGDNTGLYFENHYFKANPENGGKIIIPYGVSKVTGKAIMYHEGYSQEVEFTRYPEEYTLNVDFIIPPESLLLSNQATVILRPYLLLNNRKSKVENLNKTKVLITLSSFTDADEIINTFDNLKLSSDRDLELNFNIPANLEKVKIKFMTTIYNKSQQRSEILTSEHEVLLKTNSNH